MLTGGSAARSTHVSSGNMRSRLIPSRSRKRSSSASSSSAWMRFPPRSVSAKSGKSPSAATIAGARVTVRAPAKLNLFLHVGDKRPDGYHALQSLVAFADIGDVLEIAPAPELSLTITGPFAAQVPGGATNLVLKAARALAERYAPAPLGASIALEKNLPVAAGLGGGSADAAAALRALNRLWALEQSEDELIALAQEFGSDVPACVLSRPCWMEGRGERVSPTVSLP